MATPPSPRFNIGGDVFIDVTIIPLTWFSIVDCRADLTWGKRISMAINAATVSSNLATWLISGPGSLLLRLFVW